MFSAAWRPAVTAAANKHVDALTTIVRQVTAGRANRPAALDR